MSATTATTATTTKGARDHRGPLVLRDPRFLDLRDEIEDLLHPTRAVPVG